MSVNYKSEVTFYTCTCTWRKFQCVTFSKITLHQMMQNKLMPLRPPWTPRYPGHAGHQGTQDTMDTLSTLGTMDTLGTLVPWVPTHGYHWHNNWHPGHHGHHEHLGTLAPCMGTMDICSLRLLRTKQLPEASSRRYVTETTPTN